MDGDFSHEHEVLRAGPLGAAATTRPSTFPLAEPAGKASPPSGSGSVLQPHGPLGALAAEHRWLSARPCRGCSSCSQAGRIGL